MKAFIAALCAAVVITVGMNLILKGMNFSAETTTTSPNARVGDDG
ncbi:hypothetical protein [Litoreibacter janthinus]|uniref:Uncharacterized protein n=1 Tax=Litoreibacter janthinus TaxID=670154 RepID=A0A1I6IBR1_9RHOB|nr:hypothetical protein [Litoreibacter janthinus]SFR64192.1 hypothetical protein SAMN04488002_3654 [Litoreibacter janthinus]